MSKNKKGVTIINIVALIGFSLLAFFTFMGAMMFTSGNIGASAGIALGSVILLASALAAAIYCKKVDADFAKWKKIEITAIVLFFIIAIFPARYVMHFFDVMTQREELQKTADADAAKIRAMFSAYEDAERSALSITTTGLQNALGEPVDMATQAYMDEASIKTADDIESWMLQERNLLLGNRGADGATPYIIYHQNVDSIVGSWLNDVKAWDMLSVARQSRLPGELAPEIAESLTKRSHSGKLPVISFEDGVYVQKSANQTIDTTVPALEFEKRITYAGAINVLFLLLYIIIIMLIFLDYLMARRSEKTEIAQGGTIIDQEGVNRL